MEGIRYKVWIVIPQGYSPIDITSERNQDGKISIRFLGEILTLFIKKMTFPGPAISGNFL